MDRMNNAWRISKASWAVLRKDRELAALPLLAGIAALVAFAVIAGPGYLLLNGNDAGGPALWMVGVVALVAATWISAIGQAAVIAGAGQRMDGAEPTIGSAFEAARARLGRLLEWAVLATVVSLVLDQVERRFGILGRVVSWIGSVAFSVLSFLALPVIVFEDIGPIDAFKRSSTLLKGTWGEQVTFNFGMGLLGLVAMLPGIAVGGLLLATGFAPLVVLGGAVLVVWIAAVVTVASALSAVFKAALYRWAVGLPVDPAFDADELSGAFRRR